MGPGRSLRSMVKAQKFWTPLGPLEISATEKQMKPVLSLTTKIVFTPDTHTTKQTDKRTLVN